jgi:hypothetical protein
MNSREIEFREQLEIAECVISLIKHRTKLEGLEDFTEDEIIRSALRYEASLRFWELKKSLLEFHVIEKAVNVIYHILNIHGKDFPSMNELFDNIKSYVIDLLSNVEILVEPTSEFVRLNPDIKEF